MTIRNKLGVNPGECVGFEEREGRLEIRKAARNSAFDKWAGKLGHLSGRRSDEIVRESRGHEDGDGDEHHPGPAHPPKPYESNRPRKWL